MRLTVEIVAGTDAGSRVSLQTGDVSRVGRDTDADIRITDDPLVSRHHCVFECADAVCRLRDLGSSNGTFVNGERISAVNVRDGDVIEIGKTRLAVRIEGRQQLTASPAPARPAAPRVVPKPEPPAQTAPGRREPQSTARPAPAPPRRDPPPVITRKPAPAAPPAAPAPASRKPTTVAPATAAPRSAEGTIKYGTRRPYAAGLEDPDAGVRKAALLAAAWAREPWVLDHCRKLAARPSPKDWDALLLFAILGQPTHLQHILELPRHPELGARRFRLLGAFGHPGVVPALLEAMSDADPLTAATAGAAFTKITGAEIDSGTRVEVTSTNDSGPRAVPNDGDEADPQEIDEIPEDVTLPSVDLARAHWNEVQKRYSEGTRWCRGFDLSRGVAEDVLDQLDMESRWEACLRGRFEGTWQGSLVDLERFPLGRA